MKKPICLIFSLVATFNLALAQTAAIRTPAEKPEPRLTGAKIFGARPGNLVTHRLTATGAGEISFSTRETDCGFWSSVLDWIPFVSFDGLPKGISLDPKTGLLSGRCNEPGEYTFTVVAENSLGKSERNFTLKIGEELALTPPMGWSSWYCFSAGVTDERIRTAARGMVNRGLAKHGWTYINIDDCWQGFRDGREGPLQGNERFPDMKALCDYVHSLGLKIGIYSSPWMSTYDGHLGGSINKDGFDVAHYLPVEKRKWPTQVYGGWPGKLKVVGKEGDTWLFDIDAKQWAEWGFDYLKADWKPNDIPTTKRMADALRASGRDIVLSLSNDAPIANAKGLAEHAQLWRTTGDIRDNWGSIMGCINRNARWAEYSKPGNWNDPDMLQVGAIGTPSTANVKYRPTKLTPDECYTQVSLWAISASPLILSCDLEGMDDFTYALLTNDEIIDINQDILGVQGKMLKKYGDVAVWMRPLSDGSKAVAVVNHAEKEVEFTLKPEMLSMTGFSTLRDVWTQTDLDAAKPLTVKIPRHSAYVYKITEK